MWAQKYGIDGCRGWIVGFTCYKEQLVAKGPTFASKVGNGKPMDYKSNKGFLNSINHESFTLIEPDLNPITHYSVSIGVDTWGNIHYGWIGRVFKIHEQDLLDGSHGKLHVFGPFFKHLSAKEAGTTQLADDEAVKAGFEMFDRCGDSCSRSDLDDALRRVAPKLLTADMKDKIPGAHARTK